MCETHLTWSHCSRGTGAINGGCLKRTWHKALAPLLIPVHTSDWFRTHGDMVVDDAVERAVQPFGRRRMNLKLYGTDLNNRRPVLSSSGGHPRTVPIRHALANTA